MHMRARITAVAVALLGIGTAMGVLRANAQGGGVKASPSRSSYASVNEENFRTLLARMSAARRTSGSARWSC